MLIIGIAGGTGSGKTTVVRKIVDTLPANTVAVIPQDSYYNDQSDLPLEVRKKLTLTTGRLRMALAGSPNRGTASGTCHRTTYLLVSDVYATA